MLREIVAQSRKQGPLDVQKLTTQEIRALRVQTEKEASFFVGILRIIQGFFGAIFRILLAPFHGNDMKRSSQCDIYGHVVEGTWGGGFPKCAKCGQDVTSPDQLRGSTPKKIQKNKP
jgi:hypothetical protein